MDTASIPRANRYLSTKSVSDRRQPWKEFEDKSVRERAIARRSHWVIHRLIWIDRRITCVILGRGLSGFQTRHKSGCCREAALLKYEFTPYGRTSWQELISAGFLRGSLITMRERVRQAKGRFMVQKPYNLYIRNENYVYVSLLLTALLDF